MNWRIYSARPLEGVWNIKRIDGNQMYIYVRNVYNNTQWEDQVLLSKI